MASAPFRRSAALWLAVIYGLLIVYASLHPFNGWRPLASMPAWQAWWLPWPPWRQRFDEFANVAGYIPFGALVFLAVLRRARGALAGSAGKFRGRVFFNPVAADRPAFGERARQGGLSA